MDQGALIPFFLESKEEVHRLAEWGTLEPDPDMFFSKIRDLPMIMIRSQSQSWRGG